MGDPYDAPGEPIGVITLSRSTGRAGTGRGQHSVLTTGCYPPSPHGLTAITVTDLQNRPDDQGQRDRDSLVTSFNCWFETEPEGFLDG